MMKSKSRGKKLSKLGLPVVFFLCFCFFFAGLFGSFIIFQRDERSLRSRIQLLESQSKIDQVDLGSLPHGQTGQPYVLSIPFQVLSWKPRALYFPNFASAEHCETIIELARSRLQPSQLALRKGETAEQTKGIRTSSGTFLSSSEDKTGILDFVEKKIAAATRVPVTHGEAFNVLRYEVGQRYVSHYDSFNPAEYGPQTSQRIASFLLYLSDVEEGGETMFPHENGLNMRGYDYEKCIGLKVKPRQGDGLLFYNVLPNGTIDKMSLHGSCLVIKGEKWVATKWIRDQGFRG